MTDNAVQKPSSPKDDSQLNPNQDVGQKQPPASGSQASKEMEPSRSEIAAEAEEAKLMAEIRTTAEAADRQAMEALQASMKEIKSSVPEVDLKPDVEDAGVVSPTKAAEEVVKKGTTIDVGIDENEYKKGLSTQISGKSDEKKVFVGASSLAAMAIWIGRLLKMAHKHTIKVVFGKGKKNAD